MLLILLLLIVIGIVWLVWFRTPKTVTPIKDTYRWRHRPDPTVDTYAFTELSDPGTLYCGFFGKKVISSTSKGIVTLECECEPVEIENGLFDIDSWDYTCNEGYRKWFDTGKRKYRTSPGLRDDISLRELYAKKPDDQSFCVPVKNI
jgi:hypothetical protein